MKKRVLALVMSAAMAAVQATHLRRIQTQARLTQVLQAQTRQQKQALLRLQMKQRMRVTALSRRSASWFRLTLAVRWIQAGQM